ncbi:MAG: hypothetical protein K0U98_05950 [Deltaproteobacteria bacterium]|nr:hypothetical protein [Deltaproteobacteria bacterium]
MATKTVRKRTGGRRTKLTPEVQTKIVTAIRAGNYACVAAEYAGITEATFYGWLRRGREAGKGIYFEFLQSVKGAEREAEVRAVALVQKHMEGNWTAAMTFLERKFPQRWGRRDRLSIDVDPREALAQLLGASPDEIETVVDEVAGKGN